jgi:hypothetical protein
MVNARLDALALLKAWVDKAKEDLVAVKRGTIDKKIMGSEQRTVSSGGTVRYKFSSTDAKKSAIAQREQTSKACQDTVDGRLSVSMLHQQLTIKPGSHDPFHIDTELTKAIDAMQIGPMRAAIDGDPGRLQSAEVSEVWKEGEVVIAFRKSREAERVLLKGTDTKMVADGFGFVSGRIWMVTGKQTYSTVGGVDRSILVAEPVDLSPYLDVTQFGVEPIDQCRFSSRVLCSKHVHSRIVQILGNNEMLVTMRAYRSSASDSGVKVVLLRGVDTTALTEDSSPPFGEYVVTGTYRYKGTDGAARTVFVVERK